MQTGKRIRLLDESVKTKIAAGEVIEGPHSIVKELIENSIDANSNKIKVSIEEGGLKRISVEDNGTGMFSEDVPLSLKEHATSKIDTIDDIHNIQTYGFRGEALSSISSVSHLIIESRHKDEEVGCRVVSKNDKIETYPFAGRTGTSIHVSNLFYNTPARKKFLKAKASESRKVKETLIKIAIANKHISFEYEIDGRSKSSFNSTDVITDRLDQIFGNSYSESLFFDTVKDVSASIQGFISKPGYFKKNRKMQYFYVNGRPVEYKPLSFHLNRAYDSLLASGEHPSAFIFLTIEPSLVDVNVHPAKKEVRLFDSKYIDSLIYGFACKILDSTVMHVPLEKKTDTHITVDQYDTKELFFAKSKSVFNQSYIQSDAQLTHYPDQRSFQTTVKDVESKNEYDIQYDSFSVLGVLFETYLFIDHEGTLKIIDFHAAHERINYDLLVQKTEFETQLLVIPEEYRISEYVKERVIEFTEILNKHGFEVDQFSDESLLVRGVPEFLREENISEYLDDFFNTVSENSNSIQDYKNHIIETMACHNSKRSGDSLSIEDQKILAREILSGKHELRCPHGRPILLELTKMDMERFFRRQ
jgi:DNA mismatch repair protein MutL